MRACPRKPEPPHGGEWHQPRADDRARAGPPRTHCGGLWPRAARPQAWPGIGLHRSLLLLVLRHSLVLCIIICVHAWSDTLHACSDTIGVPHLLPWGVLSSSGFPSSPCGVAGVGFLAPFGAVGVGPPVRPGVAAQPSLDRRLNRLGRARPARLFSQRDFLLASSRPLCAFAIWFGVLCSTSWVFVVLLGLSTLSVMAVQCRVWYAVCVRCAVHA